MKKVKSHEKMNRIGKKIREAREERGMSQEDLSIQLELIPVYICRGSISRIENGSRLITDVEIEAIAKVLKVSPNYLFNWGEE